MTMQIASSNNSTSTFTSSTIKLSWPQAEPSQNFSDILTPEQKNTVQQGADAKIAEQVEKVKSNYQTAKDIDLMQSYYPISNSKNFLIYTCKQVPVVMLKQVRADWMKIAVWY